MSLQMKVQLRGVGRMREHVRLDADRDGASHPSTATIIRKVDKNAAARVFAWGSVSSRTSYGCRTTVASHREGFIRRTWRALDAACFLLQQLSKRGNSCVAARQREKQMDDVDLFFGSEPATT
jgi:hypothetical protein